jgi:hypothetical protein
MYKVYKYFESISLLIFSNLQKKRLRDNYLIVNLRFADKILECFDVPLFRTVFVAQPSIGSVLIYDQDLISKNNKKIFEENFRNIYEWFIFLFIVFIFSIPHRKIFHNFLSPLYRIKLKSLQIKIKYLFLIFRIIFLFIGLHGPVPYYVNSFVLKIKDNIFTFS